MALPPLAPSNTARFRVNYTVGGEQHDFQVRSAPVSPSALGVQVDTILSALAAVLNQVTIDSIEFAASGSNVFNIVTTGIEGNTYGSGAGGGSARANYIDFIGRSSGGRRVRLAVFGLKVDATDYRFVSGENTAVDNTITSLNAAVGSFLAIDGISPQWYSYANAGVNAHWQKAVRP